MTEGSHRLKAVPAAHFQSNGLLSLFVFFHGRVFCELQEAYNLFPSLVDNHVELGPSPCFDWFFSGVGTMVGYLWNAQVLHRVEFGRHVILRKVVDDLGSGSQLCLLGPRARCLSDTSNIHKHFQIAGVRPWFYTRPVVASWERRK